MIIPRAFFARSKTPTPPRRKSAFSWSGKSAIETHETAVNKNVLPGDVTGLRRNQKQDHGGNFFRLRHSFSERNLRNNVLQFFLRIGKRVEPPLVKRSHHLGRDNRVHAHAVGEQLRRPIASKR